MLTLAQVRWFLKPSVRRFYVDRLLGRTTFNTPWRDIPLTLHASTHTQHRIVKQYAKGDFIEAAFLQEWVERARSAHVVYDIGGFTGLFGLLAAKVNPSARVIVFEPDPYNARHVRENIRLNHLSNCALREVAVTNYEGEAFFEARGKLGSHISRHPTGVKVTTTVLDDAADLIKIDVEGLEAKVLEKADLRRKPVIFLEVHDQLSQEERNLIWTKLDGYTVEEIGHDEGNPHYMCSV